MRMRDLMLKPSRTHAMEPFDTSSALAPLTRMQREMDRLFAGMVGDNTSLVGWQGDGGMLVPAIDVSETDGAIEVTGDLPGMAPSDIEITLSDNVLALRGERKEEKEEKGKNFHHSERRYGTFLRRVALPCEVEADKIEAKFADGVLKITLPKAPQARSSERRIEIKS